MAGGTVVDFSGFDNEDGHSELMVMPKKITLDEQEKLQSPDRSQMSVGSFDPMTVPERIVVNGDQGGYLASKNEIPRELKEDFIPNVFMGGMSTPPRTLTVDDTTSAYYPQTKSTSKPNVSVTRIRTRQGQGKTSDRNYVDHESIITGLEIIDEVNPLKTDSEEGDFVHEYEVVDLRKNVITLNRRVAILERHIDRNGTFGFWSKMLFLTLTIVNPLILSWLFGRRR